MAKFIKRSYKYTYKKTVPLSWRKQLKNFIHLSCDYGQFHTIKNWKCVDHSRQHIPWYTFPTIDFLNAINMSNFHVFEYGSGFSTLYYARRARLVTCFEHDTQWLNKMNLSNYDNVSATLAKDTAYSSSIVQFQTLFDIVAIDGILRPECSDYVIEYVKNYPTSIIIFDNSDWYPASVDRIYSNTQWTRIPFRGFGPINDYCWETTLFINPSARLQYIDREAPIGQKRKIAPNDR